MNGIIKEFWKRHIYSESVFPRDLGLHRYPKAQTWDDYYSYIMQQISAKDDAYVAVYSAKEIDTGQISRIFIDIDADDIGEAWEVSKDFIKIFWPYIEVYFSGKKGFHIYLYTKPFNVSTVDRRELISWLNSWTMVDPVTVLDLRRICRIPLTIHSKTQLWAIPVAYNASIDAIVSQAREPSISYLLPFLQRQIFQWDISFLPCACDLLS